MLVTFERAFVAVNRWVVILLLSAMSVIVFANVVLRYTTRSSLAWSDETSRYLMIWMVFLSAGLVLRYGGHVAMENLHWLVGRRGAVVMRSLIAALLMCFFVVMFWNGVRYMHLMQFQTTAATGISYQYVYSVIPLGFLLLIVHLLFVVRGYVVTGTYVESIDMNSEAQTEDQAKRQPGVPASGNVPDGEGAL